MNTITIARKLQSALVVLAGLFWFGAAQATVYFSDVNVTDGASTATLVFKEDDANITGITFDISFASGITLKKISLSPNDAFGLITYAPILGEVVFNSIDGTPLDFGDPGMSSGGGVSIVLSGSLGSPAFQAKVEEPLEIFFLFNLTSLAEDENFVTLGCVSEACEVQRDEAKDYIPVGTANINLTSDGQVPEPGTLAMLGLGLIGLAVSRRRARMH